MDFWVLTWKISKYNCANCTLEVLCCQKGGYTQLRVNHFSARLAYDNDLPAMPYLFIERINKYKNTIRTIEKLETASSWIVTLVIEDKLTILKEAATA